MQDEEGKNARRGAGAGVIGSRVSGRVGEAPSRGVGKYDTFWASDARIGDVNLQNLTETSKNKQSGDFGP